MIPALRPQGYENLTDVGHADFSRWKAL